MTTWVRMSPGLLVFALLTPATCLEAEQLLPEPVVRAIGRSRRRSPHHVEGDVDLDDLAGEGVGG